MTMHSYMQSLHVSKTHHHQLLKTFVQESKQDFELAVELINKKSDERRQ